jgi:hypothetical protein
MSKFTFISQYDKALGSPKSTMEFEAVSIDDVLGYFEDFLRGAGYQIDGQLMIYKEEESPFNDFSLSKDGELDLEARQSFDLDDLDSIFSGKKSLIRSDDC